MREFFNGWRRKIGVVTLGLACVFAASWIRSMKTVDTIWVPAGGQDELAFLSASGYLGCERIGPFAEPFLSWDTTTITGVRPRTVQPWISMIEDDDQADENTNWFWMRSSDCAYYGPYWSLVIPLTLISASLLLSKPRPAPVSANDQ